jgi:membrane-anchored glycerophosphoryl diester phosphodiesterase (GDPDase)
VDVLGELGGYMEVLYVIFFLIVYPFSEYGFMISSINKLFLAKTLKPEAFKGR